MDRRYINRGSNALNSFSQRAGPVAVPPWFHFAFFFFWFSSSFTPFLFLFWFMVPFFFLFLLGLDSSYSISPVPFVGNLLIFHAFVLSSVRASLALPQGFYF